MIDVIGILYDQPPVNNEGEFTRRPAPLEGFHVNSTIPIVGLDAYQVIPEAPRTVFSGVVTYFYSFPSEQDAKDLIGWNEEDGYTPSFVPVKDVPEKIKASNGLLVLADIDIYDQLKTYMSSDIASIQEKIIYEREPYWYRNDALVTGMAAMFSLTDDQVDDLFIQAAAL